MRRDKIALLAKVLKMNPVSFITGEFKEEERTSNSTSTNKCIYATCI